ncbi:unnamed protein product [Caenorhabditis sp. 36 PRJEB53466]|nr:unnamed protein product [Caenorhabditis sp. 36 PRJEB53466]
MFFLEVLIILLFFLTPTSCQVTIAKNTKVTPRCGSQLISIELNFDPTQLPDGKFSDWIIVGVSGRPECRLRGNGETKYIIEIAVFNDPCLTQIPARNVFQNRIRIGKNPVVILEEDQSITVKCVYGLPTVETMTLPIVNANFNIDNMSDADKQSATHLSNLINSTPSSFSVDFLAREFFQKRPNITTPENNREELSADDMAIEEVPSMVFNENHLEKKTATSIITNQDGNIEFVKLITESPSKTGSISENLDSKIQKPNSYSFSMMFVLATAVILLLFSGCFVCCLLLLKNRFAFKNRRLLENRVFGFQERENISEKNWATSSSGDGCSGTLNTFNQQTPNRILNVGEHTSGSKRADNGNSAIYSLNEDNHDLYGNARRSIRTRPSMNVSKKETALTSSNLPFKSNLQEFVSKTYALGEYNNLASPAYAFTSEVFDEREVDVANGSKYEKAKDKKRTETINNKENEDSAVSSFRSITEIVHAAETAIFKKDSNTFIGSNNGQRVLIDCVNSIRGFGYRKLTEQEIIRWKNLIHQDSNIVNLLIQSKSLAEIENIFERDDYKNMFTFSKWHEIALCVHQTLTSSLDRSNSRSELQLFVGNVQTEW